MKSQKITKLICNHNYNFNIKENLHWEIDKIRQHNFLEHRETKTIFLRFRDNLNDFDNYKIIFYPLFEIYEKDILVFLNLLKKFYIIEDYCAIITNLPPKSRILKHKDYGKYFEQSYRIHIPIKTNLQTIFEIDEQKIHMKIGEVYEINNLNSFHSVSNNGNTERHHIIFDIFGERK